MGAQYPCLESRIQAASCAIKFCTVNLVKVKGNERHDVSDSDSLVPGYYYRSTSNPDTTPPLFGRHEPPIDAYEL